MRRVEALIGNVLNPLGGLTKEEDRDMTSQATRSTSMGIISRFARGWRGLVALTGLASLAAAPSGCGGEYEEEATITEEQFPAFIKRSLAWPNPRAIVVCWTNPTLTDAAERGWVRNRVQAEFANREEFHINFTGWRACRNTNDPDIRIRIADETPHTVGIGEQLRGRNPGMVLNFTFNTWCPNCAANPQANIEAIAVHEFLHAAGFDHEQNRSDSPSGLTHGPDKHIVGDEMVGEWDLSSVSNYNNPNYNNGGRLSSIDRLGLHQLYDFSGGSVILFQHANYQGKWSRLGIGRYFANRNHFSIGNDSASSIRVFSDYVARICSHEAGGKGAECFRTGRSIRGLGYVYPPINDTTSFLEVTPAVHVFAGAEFSLPSQKLGLGTHKANRGQLWRVGNDRISSMSFRTGEVAVKLCRHESSGPCWVYRDDRRAHRLPRSIDNQASRVIVMPVVTLYRDSHYEGPYKVMLSGETATGSRMGAIGNDQVSSIRVTPGLVATVCMHNPPPAFDLKYGVGTCRRINGSFGGMQYVGDRFNDQISYVRVRPEVL